MFGLAVCTLCVKNRLNLSKRDLRKIEYHGSFTWSAGNPGFCLHSIPRLPDRRDGRIHACSRVVRSPRARCALPLSAEGLDRAGAPGALSCTAASSCWRTLESGGVSCPLHFDQ